MIIEGSDQPEIAKKAWVARENGDPVLAIALWTQLLRELELAGEWEKVINYLVDISIAWKNFASETENPEYALTSLKTLDYAKFLAEKYNIPLRKDWELLVGRVEVDCQNYSDAIKKLEHYLETAQLRPEEKADIKSQIGFAKFKSGDKEEGLKLLEEGLNDLEHISEDVTYQDKSLVEIKRTGAKLRLARVLDDKEKAKKLAEEALQEAQEKSLGARVKEAQKLLDKMV